LLKGETTNRKPFYSNSSSSQKFTILGSNDPTKVDEIVEINVPAGEIETTEKDYIGLVKKVKKENITPENIDEIMLCQIPGVSATTAISIIKKFNSLANLIKCLEENETCLKDIVNINKQGQTRKITCTSIANIKKFLMKK
jgi:ERCC4-type nuclease